jgi:hypothetical protein
MYQSIVLTLLMTAALCGSAKAQTITWVLKDAVVDEGSWYLPRLASDGNEAKYFWDTPGPELVVAGQEFAGGFEPFQYMTGVWDSGEAVTWGSFSEYSEVENPAVAMATFCPVYCYLFDAIVEVHQGGQDSGSALWYRIASVNVTSTPIPSRLPWSTAAKYDQGFNPTIAMDPVASIDTNTEAPIVEVHQAAAGVSNLWYHVGQVSMTKSGAVSLTWGPSYRFEEDTQGSNPSVTLCNGVAIEVHEGESGTLWYSIGTVAGDTVSWNTAQKYDNGYAPSVTACAYGNTTGPYLIEAHQAANPGTGQSTPLWYHVAPYTTGGATWTAATKFATGCSPSVAPFQYEYNDGYTADYYQVAVTLAGACGAAYALYYYVGDPNLP